MTVNRRIKNAYLPVLVYAWAIAATPVVAQAPFPGFLPGNLVVSRSVYTGTASTVTVGQKLPPTCPAAASCPTATATDNGSYPSTTSSNNVWNNDKVDGSFGVTSPIFLDQITTAGTRINSLAVPASMLVTSFPSKSELALNLSQDGGVITFIGYIAPVNAIDVSNSNTPLVVDPTNPVGGTGYYRGVAQVYASGAIQITNTNAYSGNNGRAAILANGYFYLVGNAGNGSATPADLVASAGVQMAEPGAPAGPPVEVGNFSISSLIDPSTGNPYVADKPGKDNNFRGLTLFDDTLYITKGSGSNGINTVYQVGRTHQLPTMSEAASATITILNGFPTALARAAGPMNPFGIWFANSHTLYVADEGDGTTANAATSQIAGLQKWVLIGDTWYLAYVLQTGLNLGQQYSILNYPTALNPATDGLRNITGRVNDDGTATIWAVTSSVSSNGDTGADPNKLVTVTDVVDNLDPAVTPLEPFTTIMTAGYGEVLRGVSFTPGTQTPRRHRF